MLKEGTKYDADKLRFDLLPILPLNALTRVLTYGAAKYAARNWEAGMDWSRPYSAALRHLFAWWQGEELDPETGLSHLAHAACNLLFLLEYETTYRCGDDRPRIQEDPALLEFMDRLSADREAFDD